MAGGVLLAPGTAFASTPYSTTTTITSASPAAADPGTLTVDVSVSAGPGNPVPTSGTVDVTGAGNGCIVTLTSTSTGAGSCSISNLLPGGYPLTATYEGTTGYNQSLPSSPFWAKIVGQAPAFNVANPSQTATPGQNYSYTFHANGYPAPTYSLAGAPKWLNINSSTGTVWGTVPYWASSFSYSVVASNGVGSPATAGPFWVKAGHGYVSVSTYLSCTPKVFTGQNGSCTLWVTNRGYSPASNVTAQIALPPQLRADYCGYFWSFGCRIIGNTAYQNLGTLSPGQTKALTVVFTAKSGWGLWGRHPGYRFTVKVVGSASSNGYWWFFGQRQSYSVAYVTIIPRGFWW